MLFLTRSRPRTALTAISAGAVVATALVFASAPVQAAPQDGDRGLSWNISEHVYGHLSPFETSDGAVDTGASFTWKFVGEETSGGVTSRSYQGTVEGSFRGMYGLAITDPVISFDASGAGEMTAEVSGFQGAPVPPAETEPARVTVAEFDGSAAPFRAFVATPEWIGVLPAGSAEASELGITGDKPLEGKSFHPEFLSQITPMVRAHFYASGADADPKKNPGVIRAGISPEVAVTVASGSKRINIGVEGQYFDPASTANAKGVYVGLSQARNIFKIRSDGQVSGMNSFVASDWVMPNQFSNGSWNKSLTVNKKHLARGVDYVIYTWKAHGDPVSGDSQYTATPVKIQGLKKAPAKVNKKWKKKAASKKKGKLVLTVRSATKKINQQATATGKVKVKLKKGKQTKKVNGKLNKKGKVTVNVPQLSKGKWKVVANYKGDKTFKKTKTKFNFKVKK